MVSLKTITLDVLLAAALCQTSVCLAAPGGAAKEPLQLTAFEVTRSDNDAYDTAAEWIPITLPDSWPDHRPLNRHNAWYRTTIKAGNLRPPLAVYIPRHSMNLAVNINDVEIGNGGQFSEPIARNHGRPMLFQVPAVAINPNETITLTIRVTDNSWALGYLGPVYIGDAVTLAKMYRNNEFWNVHIPNSLAIVMLIFSIICFVIVYHRRQETFYFWFGAAMLFLAFDTFNVFINPIPVRRELWEVYNQTNIFAFAVATILFVHRFTGVGWVKMERLLWLLLAAKALILPFISTSWFFNVANMVNLIAIGYGAVLLFLIILHYLQSRSFESGLTASAGMILIGVALHTWLIQAGLLTPENQHLMHLGAPGYFILIGFFMIKRFLAALNEQEQLANLLEHRVREKEQELSKTYQEISRITQMQALSEERERIMREMHDGFGGQLVGALAMLETDRRSHRDVTDLLKTSLLDLRIMIDSLDPNAAEIPVALGMLRTRIEPILRRKGVSLQWDMSNLPDNLKLKPNDTLSLLRILQELLTNIVKHSIATIVRITANVARHTEPTLVIQVWENGTGFDPANNAGKGLNNIRKRAAALHGGIVYIKNPDGFAVEVSIPCSK